LQIYSGRISDDHCAEFLREHLNLSSLGPSTNAPVWLSVTAINAEGKKIETVPSRSVNGILTFEVGQLNTMYCAIG